MILPLIAIALGLAVGLSLGGLGGGGSTLAVPILVLVAGLPAQEATTASLLVVGVASAIGAWRHHRAGNVRLGAGLAFGAAGVVGARTGTVLNRSLDEQVLLLAFSVLVVVVALRMDRGARREGGVADDGPSDPEALAGPDPAPDPGGSTVVATRAGRRLDLSAGDVAKLAGAATLVGLLTGLFGVGGGFAVVPALTLLLGFRTREAIGTSLVVIAMNAAIALAMRSGDLAIDWALVGPFLVTVTVGVLVGSRVAQRIDPRRLTRAFALMLGLVATTTALSTLLG